MGVAHTPRELELLMIIAQQEISRLAGQSYLFIDSADLLIDSFVAQLHNNQLQLVGPQLLLSPLYEEMGLDVFKEDSYLKPLIISRLVYPGSKLKTVHYLKRHFDLSVSVYTIYRYLDHLDEQKCEQIQEIIFKRSLQLYSPQTGIVFYDLTTLYFEAPDEDDLRQIGYSKDGKTQHPQIVLGLLVGTQGYPLAYQLFEGNTSETQTLIPMLKKMEQKFQLSKPIVVADAALLSKKNIAALEAADYGYILGARMKNGKSSNSRKNSFPDHNRNQTCSNQTPQRKTNYLLFQQKSQKRPTQSQKRTAKTREEGSNQANSPKKISIIGAIINIWF